LSFKYFVDCSDLSGCGLSSINGDVCVFVRACTIRDISRTLTLWNRGIDVNHIPDKCSVWKRRENTVEVCEGRTHRQGRW